VQVGMEVQVLAEGVDGHDNTGQDLGQAERGAQVFDQALVRDAGQGRGSSRSAAPRRAGPSSGGRRDKFNTEPVSLKKEASLTTAQAFKVNKIADYVLLDIDIPRIWTSHRFLQEHPCRKQKPCRTLD